MRRSDPSEVINLKTVGDRLEGIRLIFGLEQVKICKFLKTSKYIFNEVRFGRKLIPYEWVIKLCDTYGLNQNWLYQGQGEIFNKRRSDA
nr:hypothetical protein [uncultured Campylobacter sp.]